MALFAGLRAHIQIQVLKRNHNFLTGSVCITEWAVYPRCSWANFYNSLLYRIRVVSPKKKCPRYWIKIATFVDEMLHIVFYCYNYSALLSARDCQWCLFPSWHNSNHWVNTQLSHLQCLVWFPTWSSAKRKRNWNSSSLLSIIFLSHGFFREQLLCFLEEKIKGYPWYILDW